MHLGGSEGIQSLSGLVEGPSRTVVPNSSCLKHCGGRGSVEYVSFSCSWWTVPSSHSIARLFPEDDNAYVKIVVGILKTHDFDVL